MTQWNQGDLCDSTGHPGTKEGIVTQQGLMDHCGTAGPHGTKGTREQEGMLTLQNQRSTVTQQGLRGPWIQYNTTVVTLQGPMDPKEQVTGLVGLA